MVFKLIKRKSLHLSQIYTDSSFIYLTVLGNIVLFGLSFITFYIEKDVNPHLNNFGDAIWWGLSTITTVGYGDIVPVTLAGRISGILLMLSGTVLFISVTGVIVSFLLHRETDESLDFIKEKMISKELKQTEIQQTLKRIERKLNELEKKISH